jgi:hypothetical protein
MAAQAVRSSEAVIQALHTSVKGRARYKVSGLYGSASLKQHLETTLAERTEIRQASASALTGNILVLFHRNTSPTEIAALLATAVAEYQQGTAHGGNGLSVRSETARVPTDSMTHPETAALLPSRRAMGRAITRVAKE